MPYHLTSFCKFSQTKIEFSVFKFVRQICMSPYSHPLFDFFFLVCLAQDKSSKHGKV